MKKGLTITLLTVAFAVLGFQAMAMAPEIKDIPSPIVGSGDVTAATKFVYPDAINLDQYVTDDTSATSKILWSYEESGTKYILNGIDPVNDTDPSTIEYNPAAKNIAANVGGSELNPDGNARTVTIRNKDLSPLTGTGNAPGANGANNVIPAETATITLTASDGSSFSQKDLVIFSDNGGNDRLSGGIPGGGEIVYHPNLASNHGGFTFAQSSAPYDPVTQSSPTGQICMEGAALGNNQGMWVGTAADFPLAANSVYDIQMTMTGNNATPGHTPFWDIFLDNNNNTGTGLNLYGADAYFFDNEGGANAVVQADKVFHMVWTPLCVGSSAFTTEAFSATNLPLVKGRFVFRMMDIWNNGAGIPNANIQSGTVCLKDLTVIKYPIAGVKTVGSALYNQSTFVYTMPDNVVAGGNMTAIELAQGAFTVSTAGGGFTVTPSTAGRSQGYTTYYPGDTNNDYANPSTQADNFPVPIDANTIYRTTYTIAAVDSNSATNPPDALFICAETPSNEAIQQNYVTSNLLSAMPKTTASSYVSFYHTNFGTNTSQGAAWKRFRPSLIVCNLTSLGGSANNNSGAIKVSNVKVEKVTLY